MHFKVISTGWDCAKEIERTLRSVEEQTHSDWQVHIVSDPSTDEEQQRVIRDWCDIRDPERWMYTLNKERLFPVCNQVMGVAAMNPDADDVIVWLDLDGDRLAHPQVLEHLVGYYDSETELTYGSYVPDPPVDTCTPAHPFPQDVIRENRYREYTMSNPCAFNHLRTMRWRIMREIPDSYVQWPDGSWLEAGTDYAVMLSGLELAGEHHKFIEETLLIYNHAQPHPDYLYHPKVTARCTQYVLRKSPLHPLERV